MLLLIQSNPNLWEEQTDTFLQDQGSFPLRWPLLTATFPRSDLVTCSLPPFCACAQPYAKAAMGLGCTSIPRSVLLQGRATVDLVNPSCPALCLALKQTSLSMGGMSEWKLREVWKLAKTQPESSNRCLLSGQLQRQEN